MAVRSRRKMPQFAHTLRDSRQHAVTVRNGFVAGKLNAAVYGFRGMNGLFFHVAILARQIRGSGFAVLMSLENLPAELAPLGRPVTRHTEAPNLTSALAIRACSACPDGQFSRRHFLTNATKLPRGLARNIK